MLSLVELNTFRNIRNIYKKNSVHNWSVNEALMDQTDLSLSFSEVSVQLLSVSTYV